MTAVLTQGFLWSLSSFSADSKGNTEASCLHLITTHVSIIL